MIGYPYWEACKITRLFPGGQEKPEATLREMLAVGRARKASHKSTAYHPDTAPAVGAGVLLRGALLDRVFELEDSLPLETLPFYDLPSTIFFSSSTNPYN